MASIGSKIASGSGNQVAVAAIGALLGLSVALLAWGAGWVGTEGDSVFQMPSRMGAYVRELVQHGQFNLCALSVNCGYTARMPLVPLFHAALVPLIGEGMLRHLLLKNALAYGFLAWAVWRILTGSGAGPRMAAIAIAMLCLNPLSLRIFGLVGSEEGYYPFLLLPVLLVLMLREQVSARTAVFFALALFALCLTKSMLEPLCAALAMLAAMRWRTGWPLAGVAAALAGWSAWSWQTTGHPTYVTGISSIDWYNFFKGNNEYAEQTYPLLNADLLDTLGVTALPADFGPVNDEWAVDNYYKHQAWAWLAQDPWHSARFLLFKTYVVFLAPIWQGSVHYPDTISWPEAVALAKAGNPWTVKSVVQVVLILAYKLGFLATIGLALRKLARGRNFPAMVFLVAGGVFGAPQVVALSEVSHQSVLYAMALAWLVCWRLSSQTGRISTG
jgi:hypothetical protein